MNNATDISTEQSAIPGGDTAGEDISASNGNKVENTAQRDENLPAVDLDAEFEALIRGKYKEQFAKRTKAILARRFKERSEGTAQATQATQATQTDPSDDRSDKQSAREAFDADAESERLAALSATARIYAGWESEAESLRELYPDFDLALEAKDPKFVSLLCGGAGLREAYEVTHRSDLIPERLKAAVAREANRIWGELAERYGRPGEHGGEGMGGAPMRRSVASLSRAEREELERRALNGEKIIL